MTTDEGKVLLHFLELEGGYYAVEMGSEDPSEGWLLGLLKVDFAAGTAEAYKIIGTEADVAPGLTLCDQVICVESLGAYTEYAIAAVEAGATPDTTYTIVSTN
jgi:hypothetical protein